jgi:hypothetical protein
MTGTLCFEIEGGYSMQSIFEKLSRFFDHKWEIAVLDMMKGRWKLKPEIRYISYLKAENANNRHILIRPGPEAAPCRLLIDDIDRALLNLHHKDPNGGWRPGRMVVETSPANFQVWINASRPMALDEKRYWLKRLKSDPGADPNKRWGRCPGFRNRKEKHRSPQGGYPLARLIWVDWRRKARIPPPHPAPHSCIHPRAGFSPLPPVGDVCHHSLSRHEYDRGDDSATDFAYALALLRRNVTEKEIRNRIMSEREHWEHHRGERRLNAYLDRTIAKAASIVRNS